MRITQLLAVAAASAFTTTAGAQARVYTYDGGEIARTPGAWTFLDGQQEPHRAVIGVTTTATGTARDTLGLLVASVVKGSPAERAGIEEGNRLAQINGVSLRANAADVEDGDMSSALMRRLTRELSKSKPGDEVELRVYREGRMQTLKVRTADSDSLFRRTATVRLSKSDLDDRATLGMSAGCTGSRRDTLGVLVMAVPDSTPAARAGLEEGNRIAAINGVNLRVAREDAGDGFLSCTKANRLQEEIAKLKPGANATLNVYSDGRFRDVTVKVGRAADMPRGAGFFRIGGAGFPMLPMGAVAPMAPMELMQRVQAPELRREMERARVEIERVRPQLEKLRPQLERLRLDLPRAPLPAVAPRMRVLIV